MSPYWRCPKCGTKQAVTPTGPIYQGVSCDHLFSDCPALVRAKVSPENKRSGIGRVLRYSVERALDAAFLCRLCLRRAGLQ